MSTEAVASIDAERIQEFAAGVRGGVLQPGDSAYDDARAVRNGLIDRRPALFGQCHGT